MTVVIMKAIPKVISAINNLAVIPSLMILIFAIDYSALLHKITNVLLLFGSMLYIYYLVQFKKIRSKS